MHTLGSSEKKIRKLSAVQMQAIATTSFLYCNQNEVISENLHARRDRKRYAWNLQNLSSSEKRTGKPREN